MQGRRASGVIVALLAALWLALACGMALAQAPAEPDYAAWGRFADRAETSVDTGRIGDGQLLQLRAQAVDWRNRLAEAQGINAPRIATVKDQIAALGPAPAEGATESDEVAARRSALNTQLAELQAPSLRAVEGFSRAASLVAAIDEVQRTRQASALTQITPSPLLPGSWAAAATDGMAVARGLVGDFRGRLDAVDGQPPRERLIRSAAYLVLALALLIFARPWIDALPRRLADRLSDHSRDALTFVVSLGQIVIPVTGVYLAVLAVDATGLVGEWGRPILAALPVAALIGFAGRWLSWCFFPLRTDPPICFARPQLEQGRFYATLLAVATAIHHVAGRAILPLGGRYVSEPQAGATIPLRVSDAAAGVWHLPIILLGALALFRLGVVLRGATRVAGQTGRDAKTYRPRVVATVGTIARVVAAIAPLLALAGYVNLANALLWPVALSVALVALVILLQEFIADLYAMAKRDTAGSRDALAPVLIGFALVLASIPVFALIWGARPSELADWWTALRQGVQLGGVRLSPGAILTFVVVFGFGYYLTRVVQGAVRNSILPRTRLDAGAQNAAVSGLGYVGIFLAALLAITSAGIDLSSLAIVAGALSVGIGFGLQNIVSNFVSGIILLVERPVSVGDWIQVGQAQGYVKRISVRSTQIQTFDRTQVIVPNSDLISQHVTNWTRGSTQGRVIVKVGVAYGTDTRRVAEILRDIAEDQPTVLINPAPTVAFVGFSPDSMDFEIRAILSDINGGIGVQTEMRHQIIERFAAEGIQIPFATRDVRIMNAGQMALVPAAAGAAGTGAAGTPGTAQDGAGGTDGGTGTGGPRPPNRPAIPAEAEDPRITRAASSGLEDAAGSQDSGDDGDGDGETR
ncbi:DUF3772 domain-containing protein [Paracoccus luteus]|uniref:DUF3772 domain-containing protein n=1 Tax=Paracoccus luteus TaxID=2508543 RepID=UPI00106FFC34|nr:DUF3772 domain-containing protein [Paracoccus luteus]